jgi:hypothetical protein
MIEGDALEIVQALWKEWSYWSKYGIDDAKTLMNNLRSWYVSVTT